MDRPSLRDFAGVPMITPPPTTTWCDPHTPHPAGYVARAEWFEAMAETYTQRACKGCGKFLVWEPKAAPGE